MNVSFMELSDDDLARRVVPGQPDSEACFQRLHERHAQGVWLFLRNRFPQEADDLLQETWLRAWRALPQKYQPGNFRAWIFQIARNCLGDRLRKVRKMESADLDQVAEIQSLPDSELLQEERRSALSNCLEKLPPRQREIVEARTAGEETETISQRLQINANSIYKLFHEARQRLIECAQRVLS